MKMNFRKEMRIMAQEIKQWVPHEYQEDAIQWVLEGFE